MPEIIEKELSYVVNGCIFDVHNEVGPGLREECYQKAMEIRLAQEGLSFTRKPKTRRELIYLGQVADVFEPDLIVSDRLIIELKAVIEGLPAAFFRQTINYLKCWRLEIGLIVNFADAKADIRRIVFHEPTSEPHENFAAVRGTLDPQLRDKLIAVRETVHAVHAEFGLGYSDRTYRNLLEIAVRHRGMSCNPMVIAEPMFRDRKLPDSPISPLLVDDAILVQVEAVRDGVTARAMRTMQTHLGCMNVQVGVIAGFGQSRFEIRGVRPHK